VKEIKKKLFIACAKFVHDRADTIQNIINSNQQALSSETKSSAGDKHETGRAMLQLEMEKASQQLSSINDMKSVLSKINLENSDNARLGSLVVTNHINYFLAVSAGEIKIENQVYYAISPSSPIGRLLLGKRVGEVITYNKEINILEIY
jgi:transcription elongation GreA/GreB family factor